MNRPLVVILASALLIAARPASACSCGQKPAVAEAVQRSSVVALVRVTRVADQWTLWRRIKDRFRGPSATSIEAYVRDYGFRVAVDVLQQWKGEPAKSLELRTGRGGGDCGYSFEVGQTYLVYAGRGVEGLLGVNICSRTVAGQDAGLDIQALDQLAHQP
jgi:hypothetical protein